MVVMRVIKSPFSFFTIVLHYREFFLILYQRKVTTDLIIARENKFRETWDRENLGTETWKGTCMISKSQEETEVSWHLENRGLEAGIQR
jgi:hypothetical protein